MSEFENKKLKKDLVWNTLGSLVYAASIAVLAFLVMRIAGEEDGGIFGFGFSTFGQQMFIIAYFGTRPFQITDVRREFSFATYRRARIWTCLTAVIIALIYLGILALLGTYTPRKALIIFLLSLYKIADGYADVYESECQRDGFLWRGGRELCVRTILVSAAFLITLILTVDLVLASALAVVCQVLCILVFRFRLEKDAREHLEGFTAGRELISAGGVGTVLLKEEKNWNAEKNAQKQKHIANDAVLALLGTTALLFFSVFLDFYVFSGSKYAIDRKLGDAASGIFNILFMPTSVIYMAANFVIKPFMTRMAKSLKEEDEAAFTKTRRNIALIILGLTVLGLLCVVLLGKWALGVFEWILGAAYEGKLTGHVGDLFLIILGGGLYALANLYYYILVIKRKQKIIFLVYLFAAMITFVAAPLLVETMGITGASICYAAMMSLLAFGLKLCDMLS